MRYRTLKQIDRAGFDVRLWCYACARGETIDGIIWSTFVDRGWSYVLEEARPRFRCKSCNSSADVLILPATAVHRRDITWSNVVEYWFHNKRKGGLLL